MAEWGLEEWGLDAWGLLAAVPPTIHPLYPPDGATDVLPWAYATFVVADQDTDIDLTNTLVIVYQWIGGVWIGDIVYNAGAFVGAWAAESSTVAYVGSYGAGYTFSIRKGVATWGNNLLSMIYVFTTDLDAAPLTSEKYWQFRSISAFDVVTTQQVDRNTLLVTFTNQVADSGTASQNALATSVRAVSRSSYDIGSVIGINKDINAATVRKITRGVGMLPNQLLIHCTKLVEGESYCLTYGSYNPASPAAPIAGFDLQDMYGQLFGNNLSATFMPKFLTAQTTKADLIVGRIGRAGYDISENSNVSGIIGAIGLSDDTLGGSGTSRKAI